MRLVFMGTPDFSVTVLKALLAAGHEVLCAYAQPPRPAGRGMALKPTPIHAFAESQGIEVRTPTSFRFSEVQKCFTDLNADAAVVVAYGLLLPKPVLDAPRFGCFNVHASLLPRWRGAAPIQRAIMAGDAQTGVTIMRMDEGLDTGPMLVKLNCDIDDTTTASKLHDQLAKLGAEAIVEALRRPDQPGMPQPIDGVTYAQKINKGEAKIDFSQPANAVLRQIHGLSPFPGAWCILNGARVKVLKSRVIDNVLNNPLAFHCDSDVIEFLLLQREGKGAMDAATFLRGFPIAPGTRPG